MIFDLSDGTCTSVVINKFSRRPITMIYSGVILAPLYLLFDYDLDGQISTVDFFSFTISVGYFSYFTGNLLQGFSSAAWKEQHNIHHAATNVLGRSVFYFEKKWKFCPAPGTYFLIIIESFSDGDLDLLPFWATVVQDLKVRKRSKIKYRRPLQVCDNWVLRMLPYQHIYWTVMLPLLRLSWLSGYLFHIQICLNCVS